MIDNGANPHIRDVGGAAQYGDFGLSNLNNLPSTKSVFFPIKKFPSDNLGDSWCYTTGVFGGKFGRVIGRRREGEGTVIQGEWNEQPAAYMFVEIKGLSYGQSYNDTMTDMNSRQKEMTELLKTSGDSFVAHFR